MIRSQIFIADFPRLEFYRKNNIREAKLTVLQHILCQSG